jgi:hypothetical protein
VLKFTQALTVVDVATKKGTRAGVVQKLVPRKGPSGSPDFFPNANPRVILSSVSAGQGGVHSVVLDLTFIDVTTRRARIDPNNQFASQQIAGGAALVEKNDLLALGNGIGCKLRLYEYTRNRPRVWGVMAPTSLTVPDVPCLLQFLPAGNAYQDNNDVILVSLSRLIDDQPPRLRFFVNHDAAGNPVQPIRFPGAAFARQFVQSGAKAVVAIPIPHGGDFGEVLNKGVPKVMGSLLRALWADGAIASTSQTAVRLKGVGISGFSFGADKAIALFNLISEQVRELFLFDPGQGVAQHQTAFLKWFAGNSQRKLLLVAGAFQTQLTALASALQKVRAGDTKLLPTDPKSWEVPLSFTPATPGLFAQAASPIEKGAPPGRAARVVETFSAVGDPNPNALTRASGIRVKSETLSGGQVDTVLQRDAPLGQGATRRLINVAHVEAAWIIRWRLQVQDPELAALKLPVTNDQEFLAVAEVIRRKADLSALGLKHQWAVCGGEGPPDSLDRGPTFDGFFKLCLQASALLK